MLQENYRLSNGVEIPKLGFGTWQIPNEAASQAVQSALHIGYRHIDTAVGYKNEQGVGEGIRLSGVPRQEIFVTTKIPGDVKNYRGAKETIQSSLEKLGTSYIDLLLIHHPKPFQEYVEGSPNTYAEENMAVWKAMEEACEAGQVRAIGLSNFSPSDMDNILSGCTLKPTVDQVRFYAGNTPEEIIDYCQVHGILVEGYSPIATGKLLASVELKALAAKYGVTVPQLCIRYVLQRGALPLPKTTHEEYMAQNADVDFEISIGDMKMLCALS